ncbi:MAG: peptidylprolyl isomerase [Pirellulales bacterium]|nr:peptidylprolyl isomerase [Pirellulales bacterium]
MFRWSSILTCCAVVLGLALTVRTFAQPGEAAQSGQETPPPAANPNPALTQPAAPAQPAAPPAGTVQATVAEQEFQMVYSKWKELLGQLSKLQAEYQVAGPADKPALEAKFNPILEEARKLQPTVLKSAEGAIAANPGNIEIANFLLFVASRELDQEHYSEAWRLAQLLKNATFPDERFLMFLAQLGGQVNEFESSAAALQALAKDPKIAKKVPQIEERFAEMQKYSSMWAKELKIREAEAKADDLPRVKLSTTKGDIVIELFENEAPNTVANFINLIEKKFYDGLIFHRVLPGFMAQGGDPKGDGTGGPGYSINCETKNPQARMHFRGTLSMAHAGPNTGGSQFFITFVPTGQLDNVHTAFGRVIEGWDVLDNLQRIDPDRPFPPELGIKPDKIVTATVVRKRNHEYTPQTNPDPRK